MVRYKWRKRKKRMWKKKREIRLVEGDSPSHDPPSLITCSTASPRRMILYNSGFSLFAFRSQTQR